MTVLAGVVLLGPALSLLGVALLVSPAVSTSCIPLPDVDSTAGPGDPLDGALHSPVATTPPTPTPTPTNPMPCQFDDGLPTAPLPFTGDPGDRLPDPTGTGGFVTRATAHLIAVTRAAFPDTSWSCWARRPGTNSEHPLGRACDVTFGNAIGVFPTDAEVAEGWRMATWLQTHANDLHVQYLIWQGGIWNIERDGEGWRPYSGGGIHNPASPTGGHYDHLHITVAGA